MLKNLKKLWAAWKRIAHRIGDFQARVLLTLIYALLVLPFGLGTRLFADSLKTKKRSAKWIDHPHDVIDLEWAHRQG